VVLDAAAAPTMSLEVVEVSIRTVARPPQLRRPGRAGSALALVAFVVLLAAIAAFEGLVSTSSASGWFTRSAQVIWTPPHWFSRTAWAAVFLLLALVGWRLWRHTRATRPSLARVLYVISLVLLMVWPPVYLDGYPVLGTTALWIAFAMALLLVVSVIVLAAVLWEVTRGAALLLVPAAVWLLYVASINLGDAVLAALD
jgi:benzodiazapine receptor